MGIQYAVEAKFSSMYDENSIVTLLHDGSKLGLIYLDFISAERYGSSPVLTVIEATNRLLSPLACNDFSPTLYVKLEDTYFHMSLSQEEEGFLRIGLGPFSYKWEKEFVNYDLHIDLARYSRVLLKLLERFKITELSIEAF